MDDEERTGERSSGLKREPQEETKKENLREYFRSGWYLKVI